MKGDVDELFLRVRGEDVADGRLTEAVVGESSVHLGEGAGEFVVGEASARAELGGTLELRVDCGTFCAVDGYGADECARGAKEGDGDSVIECCSVSLDGVIKACCEELAEAVAHVVNAERRAFCLREMSGKRPKAIRRYSIKEDAANREALPAREWGRQGRVDGIGIRVTQCGRCVRESGRDTKGRVWKSRLLGKRRLSKRKGSSEEQRAEVQCA
jgi:hypothetical protein